MIHAIGKELFITRKYLNTAPAVLIIEDEAGQHDLIQEVLQKEGFNTETARDSVEALAMLETNPDMLVVLDYILPDTSAREFISILTAKNLRIPFIVVTDRGNEAVAVQMMKMGARDYIIKSKGFIDVLPHVVHRVIIELGRERELALAYQALRESEERYRRITCAITDYMYRVRVENGLPVETIHGDACISVTGYSSREFAEDQYLWISMVVDEDRGMVRHQVAQALSGRFTVPIEHRIIRKDGALIWVESTLIPNNDINGNLIFYDGVVRDITRRRTAEEELRKESELRRILLDNMPCIAVILNKYTQEIVACNDAAGKLGAVVGKTCHDSIALDGVPCPFCGTPEVWDSGEKISIEIEWLGRFWRGNRISLTDDLYVHYIYDITKSKLMVDSLKESEQRFRNTFEQAAVGIVHTAADGRFLRINQRVCDLTGYTHDELLGMHFQDITHPDDLQADLEYIKKVIKGEIRTFSMEKRYIRKDGAVVWVNLTVSLVRDEAGSAKYFIGVIEDISDRKQAEDALHLSEEKFSKAFHSSPALMSIKTLDDGEFLEVNDSFITVMGYNREELIRHTSLELGMWDDPSARNTIISRLREKGFVDDQQVSVRTKTGEILDLLWSAEMINIEGKPCILTAALNITEWKRLKEQLMQAQKMESIGTLAGGIAHDFNNILNAIMGFAYLIKMKTPQDSDTVEHVDSVMEATDRAAKLVHQILTFSRMGPGEYCSVDITPIVKESLKLIRSSIPATIDIRSDIEAAGYILADPTQMHQVVMNLCTNAYHAMQDTGGVLEVGLKEVYVDAGFAAQHAGMHSGPHIRLIVSDTGKGIAPEITDRIFEPYFTTKGKGKGTGLGLSLTHGIIKNCGGTITVSSELNKGTVFTVYIPVSRRETETDEKTSHQLKMGTGTVLLVDDEKSIVGFVREILESLGYRVVGSMDSLEALELFKKDPGGFDAVITDMTMPKMTGLALSRRIMEMRPDIPVVLTTGFYEGLSEDIIREAGIREMLMKPVTPEKLSLTLHKLLEKTSETNSD